MSLFAKGVNYRGPNKDGLGEINISIRIGGTVIHPGNLIVRDMDRNAVVPKEMEVVAEKVKKC
ncbi:hypothetical protein ACDX78_07680 [Virgibacillus oceani]